MSHILRVGCLVGTALLAHIGSARADPAAEAGRAVYTGMDLHTVSGRELGLSWSKRDFAPRSNRGLSPDFLTIVAERRPGSGKDCLEPMFRAKCGRRRA